jgi:hypothetical protein
MAMGVPRVVVVPARTATSRRVLWVVGNGRGVAVECGWSHGGGHDG